MSGKLVLCAVLCVVFVSQGCYARPQEVQNNNEIEVNSASADNYGLLRVTSCRNSLRKIVYTLAMLGYDLTLLSVEIFAAVIETIKCVISRDIGNCSKTVISDTVDGFRSAIADFADKIVNLGQEVADGLKNCLLSTNNANYQLFLGNNENYSKVDIYKTS